VYAIFLSIAGFLRFALMGAVRRTSAGWHQAVKPFDPVGWHHSSKVVAMGLIKTSPLNGSFFTASWGQGVWLANAVAATRLQQKPLNTPGELARTFAKFPSESPQFNIISLLSALSVFLSPVC